MADKPTPDEFKRRYKELREKAVASFPFARVEAAGDQALATWRSVAASGRGAAVVVGDDDALNRLIEMASEWPGVTRKTPEEILELASRLRHPDDLISQHSIDTAAARERFTQLLQSKPDTPLPHIIETAADGVGHELSREETIAAMLRDSRPEVGEWPTIAPASPQLSVADDPRSGMPLLRTHLIIVPTDDWTTIPAHLRWGAWNGCPAPEYHVAAPRSWRERFGAELVGLGPDVMNIKVARKPETRAAALDLAREQFAYCSDIVEQGVGTLSALAASLMENDWWYFWWD